MYTVRDLQKDNQSRLVELLKQVNPNSVWGMGIKISFDRQLPLDDLIAQLRQQASEDSSTMEKIIGKEATKLLMP